MNFIDVINAHLNSGIKTVEGVKQGSDSVIFHCKDGYSVELTHIFSCCEDVYLYDSDNFAAIERKDGSDIYTDTRWAKLEVETQEAQPQSQSSATWTFYKIQTNKGYDTLRWFGESNGNYSEDVRMFVHKENNGDNIEDTANNVHSGVSQFGIPFVSIDNFGGGITICGTLIDDRDRIEICIEKRGETGIPSFISLTFEQALAFSKWISGIITGKD